MDVIVECPRAAGLPDQVAQFVLVGAPEAGDAATLTHLLPLFRLNPVHVVERGDQQVAMSAAAVGKLLVARKFQADLFQGHVLLLNQSMRHQDGQLCRLDDGLAGAAEHELAHP